MLVRLGYLKPQELVWAVRRQVEEIILSLFGFEGSSSEVEFKEEPLPSDEVITLKLSAANLIYRGIKRLLILRRYSTSYVCLWMQFSAYQQTR